MGACGISPTESGWKGYSFCWMGVGDMAETEPVYCWERVSVCCGGMEFVCCWGG